MFIDTGCTGAGYSAPYYRFSMLLLYIKMHPFPPEVFGEEVVQM